MAKDIDPTVATPQERAKAVAEEPNMAGLEKLASMLSDKLGVKELREEFVEYRKQQAEHAQKALEGKPEEASKIDADNRYQAKSAFEWMRDMGLEVKARDEGKEETLFDAFTKGIAYTLVKGDKYRGFDAAVKEKALGRHADYVAKALGIDDFSSGGALLQPEVMQEVVPELLSETAVFGDSAIMTVPVNGQMEFPYEDSGPTARWSAENGAKNASDISFNQVTLRPESVGVIVPVSKKMLRSVGLAQQAVNTSLRRKFADAVDAKFIRGDGTANTPQGLRYLAASANVLAVNASVSAANTDADLLRLIQAIQAANVRHSYATMRFLFSPRTWRYLSGLRGTDVYLYRSELLAGRLLGVPVAGQSGQGVTNIPENLSVTDSSETEIYLYETSGLRMGIGTDIMMASSDVAAYHNSAGSVDAAFSRNQVVFKIEAEMGLVEVYRGKGIAVLKDVDWGV